MYVCVSVRVGVENYVKDNRILRFKLRPSTYGASPYGAVVKNLPGYSHFSGDTRDMRSVSSSGRSPGGGYDNSP